MAKKTAKKGADARRYDVVLWGATGFTGRLVAEYFAEHYAGSVRLALAGRNREKLEALRADLAQLAPAAAELDLLVGDSHDPKSLQALAAQTRVVCTTVGPYAKYGSELVATCVAERTHYCDLTGEVQWIRRMVDAHHERALESGTRIVHCCGFDSIPSDLGTFALQQAALEQDGAPFERVKFYLDRISGTFSGGTLDSMVTALEEMKDPEVRRMLGNPYALNPPGECQGPDRGDLRGLEYDREVSAWTGPFIMAAVNTRIVRRTHALLGYPWGRDFSYAEVMRFGGGARGLARAVKLTGGLAMFGLGMSLRPVRQLLVKTVLPDPGEGPSRERIETGHFLATLVGFRDGAAADAPRVKVRGRRDPGYGATAAMLAESALCLALEADSLDTPGGVLTPATAMGNALIARLNASGRVTIEVI